MNVAMHAAPGRPHPALGQSLLARRPSPLRPFLIGSAVGHAVLLLLALLYAYFGGEPSVNLDAKPITATLVRQGKPRDPNFLPRKEELPPPPKEVVAPPAPPAPPPPAAKPVAVPGVKPAPAPSPQKGAADADRRKRLFGAFSKTAKAAEPEELEGQEDGDAQGDAAQAEGERYYGLLKAQVTRNYFLPDTLPEADRLHLRAYIAIRIGRTGELLHASIHKTSGNALFDAAVLSAMKKAAPFSPPPDHLRESIQRTGVVLSFVP